MKGFGRTTPSAWPTMDEVDDVLSAWSADMLEPASYAIEDADIVRLERWAKRNSEQWRAKWAAEHSLEPVTVDAATRRDEAKRRHEELEREERKRLERRRRAKVVIEAEHPPLTIGDAPPVSDSFYERVHREALDRYRARMERFQRRLRP